MDSFYIDALKYVNDPNSGYVLAITGEPIYIPMPSKTMSLDELQTNRQALNDQIAALKEALASMSFIVRLTAKMQIDQIISIQQTKANTYTSYIQDAGATPETNYQSSTTTSPTSSSTTTSSDNASPNYVPWLLGGIALFGVYRYNKNRKRKS